MNKTNTYVLTWAPEGRVIAKVEANSVKQARRKAPKPYRKYLGEIIVQTAEEHAIFMDRVKNG